MEVSRLIILGNGFDLAHGLKTKYSDFMANYYSKIKSYSWDDEFFKCKCDYDIFDNESSLNSILNAFKKRYNATITYSDSSKSIHVGHGIRINIKNSFFYSISKKHSIENWVDIENEYFKEMLKIIDKKDSNVNKYKEVETLNNEMDVISKKFEEYLSENIVDKIEKCYNEKIDNELSDFEGYMKNNRDVFYNEFPKKYLNEMNSFVNKIGHPLGKKFLSTLVLNFNYTSTYESLYIEDKYNTEVINIHGSLNDIDNPINLGFGDEMSKRYGEIEDYNENEYLRLMKSFAYSKTDNYKRLFDFVETNNFQVYIMGHSCGISDRTLLNAIFENHNCKSIKVFYHETIKDDGTKKDNYSDIVMNISRHFNKKTLMRDKIVNKEYSQPLPQFYS